jgi:hypothetical protein
MVPAFSTGTLGVDRRQVGAAAATVNTAQQIGASLGTALLNTIAASATAHYMAGHVARINLVQGLVHGYQVATIWGTGILVLGGIVAALLINAGRPQVHGDA